MAQVHKTTTGEIFDVQDHGSIVLVFILTDDDQRVVMVPFDHRPFGWLLQGEGCEAADLIGQDHTGEAGSGRDRYLEPETFRPIGNCAGDAKAVIS